MIFKSKILGKIDFFISPRTTAREIEYASVQKTPSHQYLLWGGSDIYLCAPCAMGALDDIEKAVKQAKTVLLSKRTLG